jgi:protein TonB
MRGLFTLVSIAIHAGVFGWLTYLGRYTPTRRPTMVAVVNKPKPRPEEPKPDEPKPKPKPPPPPPVVKQAAAPAVAPPPAPAPSPAPAAAPRFASNVTLGNGPASAATGALGGNAMAARPGEVERKGPVPPPSPAAKVEDPCDAPDTKPRPLGSVQVEYPDQARADGIEGRIAVRIHVGDDGSVDSLDVLESIDPSLDAVVLSILKTWKFAPATHCGKPTAGVLAWAQRFELGD